MNLVNIPGLRQGFDLRSFTECERSLGEISTKPQTEERVGYSLVERKEVIQLGDFLIGSCWKNTELYTTEHDAVFARAIMPYNHGLAWFEGRDGLAHQLSWVVGLARLQGIKQLALLSLPVDEGVGSMSVGFNHTRHFHTYDVYALGLLCAQNAGIVGKDLLALRIALLIHDLFTPACGDLMKFVNYERYDEDNLLSELLKHENYLQLCQSLGIRPEEPIRICQEDTGILCAIRNFADTYAYTMRDLERFCPGSYNTRPQGWYIDPIDEELFQRLCSLQDNKRFRANAWEYLRVNGNGDLIITKPKALHDFLFIRACLFRILYYNRQTRNIEYLLGIRLVKILLEKGVLKHELFHTFQGDTSIWLMVDNEIGYNPDSLHNGSLGNTHSFDSFEEASEFVRTNTDRNKCGLIYRWPSKTKTKVNTWKTIKNRKELPWGIAYPEQASEIERIMTFHGGYFVAIFHRRQMHEIKDNYWEELKRLEHTLL